jgi:TatD DNase family protein
MVYRLLVGHGLLDDADAEAMAAAVFRGLQILHWFSGPLRDLKRAIDSGMYFSVNPAMTKSANGRKLAAAMPRDRVLTETDGPFVQTGGRPAVPQDTAEVLLHLATLWKSSFAEARATVLTNFLRAVGEA